MDKPNLMFEPTPLQCGQAVLCMLTGKSIEEITCRKQEHPLSFFRYYVIKYKKHRHKGDKSVRCKKQAKSNSVIKENLY